jgi:ABC-2 type transport system ATP-binding protein
MLVACRAVTRAFGNGRRRRLALDRCCFDAGPGEIVGVVGPNGAGKTTLLRLIAGELAATSGEVVVGSYRAGTRHARRMVGLASDPPVAPPELSGAEWLTYLAGQRSRSPQERLRRIGWAVEIGELESFVGRRIATYSRGMVQRLALAAAAVLQAGVLVLDEVLAGVDPLVQRHLRAQVASLARGGVCVVIASHDLAALERLATRVVVLWEGRVLADVYTAELMRERVAELTLGGSGLARAQRLLARYPAGVRTGQGVAIPLIGGISVEEILAAARDERLAVTGSRVRYRALEDILVRAAAVRAG